MIPRDPADIDALAAEYALGTLEGQRDEVRALLEDGLEPGSDAADVEAAERLRQAVGWWETQLSALSRELTPVPPSPALWASIEGRMADRSAIVTAFSARKEAAGHGLARRMAGWRLGACAAAAAFLAVVGWTIARTEEPVSAVAVLTPPPATAASGSFVLERHGNRLRVLPVATGPTPPAHDLELWSLVQGKAAPLGLVRSGADLAPAPFAVDGALAPDTTVAISLEPTGGSTTGQATGPVLYVGKLTGIARPL